jgi:outer membrane cobalamin receptor
MKIRTLFFCALLFALCSPASLFPQETSPSGGEGDFDDAFLMEGEGITLVETPETTQQMQVLTREEIEKRHAPDLAALLEEALGMGVTRYGPYGNQAEVNMRGFDTERIAILINGVPANSPRSGDFDMTSIDLNSVERIEVIYGGSDTKYNVTGALGGVINIITLKKQQPGLRFGGSFSNLSVLPERYNQNGGEVGEPQWQDLADTQMLSLFAGYGTGHSSWTANVFANRAANHFLYEDYYGYARRKEHNEVRDAGASLSYIRDLPRDATLLAGGDLYYGDKNFPVTGTAQGYTGQRDFSSRQNLMLDIPRAFTDTLSTELSLSHTWSRLEYGKDSLYRDNYLTAINRWAWYLTPELTLNAGGDYRYIHVDSRAGGIHDGHNGGLYLTGEYARRRRVIFVASLKGVTNGRSVAAAPKLGWMWKPAEVFTLKNNYFRSFKFPDFDDLYWEQADGRYKGNEKLQPEDGLGADLTVEYRPLKRLSLDSSLYGQWTTDSIHWVKYSEFWTPENVGTATFVGWDTRGWYELPLERGAFEKLAFSLSYQYQMSWLLNDSLGFADNLRIPYMPSHTVGASVDLQWKGGSALVSGRYESLRYADTGNRLKLDPHALVNITVNQSIGEHLAVFMAVRNVFNAKYTSFAEYPMPGINVTLGVRTNFGQMANRREQ